MTLVIEVHTKVHNKLDSYQEKTSNNVDEYQKRLK